MDDQCSMFKNYEYFILAFLKLTSLILKLTYCPTKKPTMSKATRAYPEGFTSRPSEVPWGCAPAVGWVPFPPKVPRRHPLIDTVGRADDPCDRPLYEPPEFAPTPAFKPPREGYPNDMCQVDEEGYPRKDDITIPQEGSAYVSVAEGTPVSIKVKLPPVCNESKCDEESPTVDDCCNTNRDLGEVRKMYEEIVGPLEEREAGQSVQWLKTMNPCQPLLPKYPCRGVIEDALQDYEPPPKDKECKPVSLWTGDESAKWDDKEPVSGWEFVDKCKTCDYYPIDKNLPERFNRPAWFKGYGCERPAHPFYVTTSADIGRFGPNPHTMTQMYHPKDNKFTEVLRMTGMYRNRTLNTANNKSIV